MARFRSTCSSDESVDKIYGLVERIYELVDQISGLLETIYGLVDKIHESVDQIYGLVATSRSYSGAAGDSANKSTSSSLRSPDS